MLAAPSLPLLLLVFAAAAAAVWIAGIYLSNTTDVLSSHFGLGQALGGVILLSIVTNLPETAITVSAALQHNLGIAIGNLLGGIAAQTVVLVILDVVGVGAAGPLTYLAASLTLVLEAVLVMAALGVAVIGTQLPGSLIAARVTPQGVLLAVLWLAGVWLVGKARTDLPWKDNGTAPNAQAMPRGIAKKKKEQAAREAGVSTARTAAIFAVSALATLVGGGVLELSGDQIAGHIGMSGVLFGATVLAIATSLPEISTGLASVKLGDYQLAMSDIFGGNAFLTVLFLVASLVSGQAVLPQAQRSDIYLTALGVLLTAVYVYGLIFRPQRQIARMGVDSLIVLVLYAFGVVGLVFVARSTPSADLPAVTAPPAAPAPPGSSPAR